MLVKRSSRFDLTRFNNIAIQTRAQMAADKEAVVSCPYKIIVYFVLKPKKIILTARMHTISRPFVFQVR